MRFKIQELRFVLKKKKKREQTQGWLDWFSVHLARKTAEAAMTEGRNFKNS